MNVSELSPSTDYTITLPEETTEEELEAQGLPGKNQVIIDLAKKAIDARRESSPSTDYTVTLPKETMEKEQEAQGLPGKNQVILGLLRKATDTREELSPSTDTATLPEETTEEEQEAQDLRENVVGDQVARSLSRRINKAQEDARIDYLSNAYRVERLEYDMRVQVGINDAVIGCLNELNIPHYTERRISRSDLAAMDPELVATHFQSRYFEKRRGKHRPKIWIIDAWKVCMFKKDGKWRAYPIGAGGSPALYEDADKAVVIACLKNHFKTVK